MKQKTPHRWQTRHSRKAIITFIAIIVLSSNIVQSQCPQNIDYTFQSQIFNFPILYPNCTEIEGYVKLSGNNIIHLDGLSNLESIGEYLLIDHCSMLQNIDGLSNVSSLGGSIHIAYCDSIEDLSGLGNIQSYHALYLISCISLESLNGLGNIASTADDFMVIYCPSLTDFSSFPNLNYVDGDCFITGLESLNNLSGLENLDSVSGSLGFRDNHSITSVDGLESLKSIGETFNMSSNYSLEDLSGLSNLHSIGSNLWIRGCNTLTNLTGLDNLVHIGQDLSIDENNSLQSLAGIDNIEAESIENLSITFNPQLTTCEVQSVCEYLANPNGDIQIYVNAPGCNNSVEVEEACTVGIPNQRSDPQLSAYPNPFTTSTTIEYELTEPSHVQLTIYNAIGAVVYRWEDRLMTVGKHTFTWTGDRLPVGLYYAVMRSEVGVSVVKMVKQ